MYLGYAYVPGKTHKTITVCTVPVHAYICIYAYWGENTSLMHHIIPRGGFEFIVHLFFFTTNQRNQTTLEVTF